MTTSTRTTGLAVVTDVAPLVDWHTPDAAGFLRSTRVRQDTRVRWAKRTRDEQERRRLRRG